MDEFSTLIADQKNRGLQTIEAWSPENRAGDSLDLNARRILSSFSIKVLSSPWKELLCFIFVCGRAQ